jgi:hypothetical protein
MLIVMVANIMWLTTELSGPLLPTDKVKNILQQVVTPIVSFGITSVAVKVAMGVRWNSARGANGVKLGNLLNSSSTTNILRSSGSRERILYLLVAAASFQNLLMNIGPVRKILVPGFATDIDGAIFFPANAPGWPLMADWWVDNDAIVQPVNIDDYLHHAGLNNPNFTFSPALLAYSQFDYFNQTLRKDLADDKISLGQTDLSVAGLHAPAMEVQIPAVFLSGQTFRSLSFDTDGLSWTTYFRNQTSSYLTEYAWTYLPEEDLEQVKLCITPLATSADGDFNCVLLLYQSVTASVAYDVNRRILGSEIISRNKSVNQLSFGYIDGSSFEEALPEWDFAMASTLLTQTLYSALTYAEYDQGVPGKYGFYRPATPFSIIGIAAYVAAASGTLLLLCMLLSTLDPKESIEPAGLLALSRWPAELAAQLYDTKESLSKAGKKRVFLHEKGPKDWVLSSERSVAPAVVQLPYQTGPQLPYQSQDMVEKRPRLPRPSMPKRLSSSSSKRHSDSYRVSRPSYSSRPSYQSRPSYHSKSSYSPPRLSPRPSSSPVPGSGSRPSYPSRPSYSSRPSYHSRPSSSSRDRPSLSRSRSQGQEEYFESEEGPEMYEGRWGVHDIR